MDNARKKYVNNERLPSCDTFALLDSIESDDEGDIENIMNDFDTEFVAEDQSVTSTNIIRKEETCDQRSSISVPEALIHILSTQNEHETDTLGQDEPNSALATQRTFSQSPSPVNQRTASQSPAATTQRISNQSPAAATQRTADQSPAAVTRHTSDQSSKSTPPPIVTQSKNNKKRKLDDQRKNEKEKGQCSIQREQHKPKIGQCPTSRRPDKEVKNQYDRGLEMEG